jgi:hypothetical protein
LHVSPVCLRKLQSTVGFDVLNRYAALEKAKRAAGFLDEAEWSVPVDAATRALAINDPALRRETLGTIVNAWNTRDPILPWPGFATRPAFPRCGNSRGSARHELYLLFNHAHSASGAVSASFGNAWLAGSTRPRSLASISSVSVIANALRLRAAQFESGVLKQIAKPKARHESFTKCGHAETITYRAEAAEDFGERSSNSQVRCLAERNLET